MLHINIRRIYTTLVVVGLLVFGTVSAAYAGALANCGPYTDVQDTSPYCADILRIRDIGVTATTGTYNPLGYVTRQQMAAFLNRVTMAQTDDNLPYVFSVSNKNDGNDYSGDAIVGYSYDQVGIVGTSGGGSFADNGVYGETNSTDAGEAGVYGRSTDSAAGVYGRNNDSDAATTTSYGVRAYSANGHGLYASSGGASKYAGYFSGDNGVRAEASGSGYGVYASSSSSDAGYFIATANDGVYASAAGGSMWGVFATSSDSYGVYANTSVSGGYGVYTSDKIYTGGGCTGCTLSLIAKNGDQESLQPGDLVYVAGIAEGPNEFRSQPMMLVGKAHLSSPEVMGVVVGRVNIQIVEKENDRIETTYIEAPDPEGRGGPTDLAPVIQRIEETVLVEDVQNTQEPAAPGDYVLIIYSGIAQVRVDTAALTTSLGQSLRTESGQPLGRLLEAKPNEYGLIWILLNIH